MCLAGTAIRDVMNKFLAQMKPPWHRNSCLTLLCSRTKHHLKTFINLFLCFTRRVKNEVTQELF